MSTNTGTPKEYTLNGNTIRSSMTRSPVKDGIEVTFLRVVGDEFDAAKIHGIREAVVYALSNDFYADFSKSLSRPVNIGSFGENLTMNHLDEKSVMIGDEYEIGSVRLKVTGPRSPCNRLNFAFQSPSAQETFVEFGRPGVYFEVLSEGRIRTGDVLKLVKSQGSSYSVAELFRLWKLQREVSLGRRELETVRHEFRKLVEDDSVSDFLRSRFRKSI
ncbi:MAG: MOSC domain-containing protein [Bdellovibrionales bacterium]|nr:MOSC domain-containing protein [Bdellovibrionales bacterium]